MELTDLIQEGLDSLWHPLTQHKPLPQNPPTHIVKGEGCYLTDHTGRTYLDAVAGLWCVNVGYGRRELADVAAEQMRQLSFLAPTMSHAPAIQLAQKLLDMLKITGQVYFSGSGSEANEAAFKVARQYHLQSGEPGGAGRYKIISRHRAYHGNTMGALSATGQAERKVGYDPMMPGFIHISPPYPYRAHEKLTPAEHGLECAKMLEETIIYEGPQTVAAFIMEPIISGGGVLVPPDTYLPQVRQVCDRYGVLLIFDEVVSGFGRTGTMFGYEHWSVKPDIFTLAKGISSGYMPLAATVVNQNIFETFLGESDDLTHFRHINTYSGHPVSTAVGLRNIEIIEAEKLHQRSRQMGAILKDQLEELIEHPYVGEVRGKGLLLGLELVADKTQKTPLAPQQTATIVKDCKAAGILIGRNGNTVPGLSNVLILAPPLILTEMEIDKIVSVLKTSLNNVLERGEQ